MKHVYIIGTCDTKHTEILYVRNLLFSHGISTCIVDVGIYERMLPPDIGNVVHLREKQLDVFADITDRGKALALMGTLLEEFLVEHQKDISGVITRKILGNAAHALAGMVQHPIPEEKENRTLVGMSMFGVTTPCVQQVCALLPEQYEPLVFHATGTGGKALEKLIDSGMVSLAIDITLTEICDLFMGGVMSAGDDRLGAVIRTGIPYVGSVGALDMVNFAAMSTVPEKYRERNLYVHNENVTLMRTTVEENAAMGRWIGERLNLCTGKVRFLLPEGGISAIDAPGMPFYDPEADAALFKAIEQTVKQTDTRRIIRVPHHLNAPEFAEAVRTHFLEAIG